MTEGSKIQKLNASEQATLMLLKTNADNAVSLYEEAKEILGVNNEYNS